MPRPRFTIRRMMVAVAGVAVACEVANLAWASERYRSLASHYSRRAGASLVAAAVFQDAIPQAEDDVRFAEQMIRWSREKHRSEDWIGQQVDERARLQRVVEDYKERVDQGRREAKYDHQLASKYERAARYPWLPVAPDPPEPKPE
jgi:hypothetical protein